MKHQQKPVLED